MKNNVGEHSVLPRLSLCTTISAALGMGRRPRCPKVLLRTQYAWIPSHSARVQTPEPPFLALGKGANAWVRRCAPHRF